MNYNTIEIYRLRSRTRHQIMGYHRRRRSPIGLLALPLLTFCATALYASLGVKEPDISGPKLEFSQAVIEVDTNISPAAQAATFLTDPANPIAEAPPGSADENTEQAAAPIDTAEMPFTPEGSSDELADEATPEADASAENADSDENGAIGVVRAEVQAGDSLAKIFARLNISSTLLHEILDSGPDAKALTDIRPGESFEVTFDGDGVFQEMYFQRSLDEGVRVWRDGEKLSSQLIQKAVELRSSEHTGNISDSLYLTAKRAGLSDAMVLQLASIFGYDIDFALDIRAGDRFSVIYQEEWLDGQKLRNGPLLAAEFVNQGQVYRAVRFVDPEGHASYYTPDGNGMKKAFIRTPVDFLRISSTFSKERCHPILGVCRPHKGVDYAAPTGTPVMAAGNGKISFRGTKNGYGNTIIVQHSDSRYTTLYAHLSKFSSKFKEGSRVKQGEIIGYVGSTGLATGPHLHYEFRINGEHRNPLTVKLPKSEPIDKSLRVAFERQSAPLIAELDTLSSSTQFAEADTGTKIQ